MMSPERQRQSLRPHSKTWEKTELGTNSLLPLIHPVWTSPVHKQKSTTPELHRKDNKGIQDGSSLSEVKQSEKEKVRGRGGDLKSDNQRILSEEAR